MLRKLVPLLGGLLIGFGIGIIVFFGFFTDNHAPSIDGVKVKFTPVYNPTINTPIPSFALQNLAGQSVNIKDFQGKPTILNFWATWCAPCQLEMPLLQSRYDQYDGELEVVGINNGENRQDIQSFVDEMTLTFEVLIDPKTEIQQLFQVRGYPTTLFIDRDGIIRVRHIGMVTENQLDEYLEIIDLP
jgi:peroxiredoxin